MTHNRIFIEQNRRTRHAVVDRKKQLIENQRVLAKKQDARIATGEWYPGRGVPSEAREIRPSVRSRRVRKKSLVLLVSFFMIFISLVPLLARLNTFIWEKKRVLQKESDLLYNTFLRREVNGGFFDSAQAAAVEADEARAAGYSIPTLRMVSYRVRAGDSLWSISQRLNVSIDSILTANSVSNVHYLNVGTVLSVPNMSGVFYTVKRGDNLSSISYAHGVDVNTIADVNDLKSSTIHQGQKLFLPGAVLNDWERASLMGTIFASPMRGRLTSRMGFRIDPFTGQRAYHTGVDIANKFGSPVAASQYGRVVFTGYKGNYGRTVIIAHPEGYQTLYAHLHRIDVKRGQAVRQGEKIGTMGNSGRSTGPHLHFEIHQNKKIIDPLKMLSH
jgi:murein DD-endopeptidase MepM/ murein hydrolase activator NlpD